MGASLTKYIPKVYTIGMAKTAVINLKTDPQLKHEATQLADALGVSLSQVLNESLRRFTASRSFYVVEDYTPTPELEAIIRRSQRSGQKVNFASQKAALDFLDTL